MSEPNTITIELKLEAHTGEEENLGEYIARLAARQLVDSYGESERSTMRVAARAFYDERIEAALEPMIEEAVNGAIQSTNSYGEPTGEPTTLREVIVKRATDILNKQDTSYHARDTRMGVLKIVDASVAKTMDDELKKTVAKVHAEVAKSIREHGAGILADLAAKLPKGKV